VIGYEISKYDLKENNYLGLPNTCRGGGLKKFLFDKKNLEKNILKQHVHILYF